MIGALLAKKTRSLMIALVMVCAIVLFTGMIFSYLNKFESALIAENSKYLSEIASHITINMQTVVQNMTKALETGGFKLASESNPRDRMVYLNKIKSEYDFAYIGYAPSSGEMTATMYSESKNIKDNKYFQRAMKGESVVHYEPVKIFSDRAISGILFFVPVYDMKKSLTVPVGVLIAMMDITNLNNIMSVSSFSGQGYTYIIDMKGEIVLRTKSMDYSNLYMALKYSEFNDGYNISSMINDISGQKEGFAIYSDFGIEKYLYYKYLGIDSWSIVTIVEKNSITAKTTALTKELTVMGIGMLVLFSGLLMFAVLSYGISNTRKQAADAKTAFLANMSHEIRTPMNAIVGISEILLREKLSGKQKDYVLSVVNAGNGLLTIINDILDISKIESGKFNIIDEEYELESLIYDITTIIAIKIGDKPVEFLVDLDPNLPKYMTGDMIRVKQILLNIIGNAVKFTQKGCIKFKVHSLYKEGHLELTMNIEDTGVGIHKKDLNKLFISFNQVDTHKNHTVEGTGLGLIISKRLAEMMGGGITVASEYGKGSTFTIKIKQTITRQEKLLYISKKDNFRVLLLEYKDILRGYFTDCLDRMGLEYDSCLTWDSFVEKLEMGGYTHVVGNRKIMQRLAKEGLDKKKCNFVTLLNLDEQSLFENYKQNVYIPLFTIQLAAVLYNRVGATHLFKRSGIDILAIQPMPFVNILIVDDNEINLQVANGLMNPYHMNVDFAMSGRKSISMLEEKDYDLIFMDHMMPEMDGVEAVKIIRSLPDEKKRSVTIVALTANVTHDAKDMFLEVGFDDFLAKPIETVKLNSVLKKWLKSKNDTRTEENPIEAKEAQKRIAEYEESNNSSKLADIIESSMYVDFKAGIAKLGNRTTYCKILETYCSSVKQKASELTDMLENDLKNFVIEIHGMKGASAGISALHAAQMAEELERLGKEEQIEQIKEVMPRFISELDHTLEEIALFIKTHAEEDEESNKITNVKEELGKERHIVVVDDNLVNLHLAENVLSGHYKVTKLSSGIELLNFLIGTKPDMVLLDVQMPNMDGYEVLRRMNEDQKLKDIPVIFLTGETGTESEREGFRLGARDFITKPFDKEVMLARIGSQMDLHIFRMGLGRAD